MKQQTAVEWLINKHFGGIENCTPDFKKHIEQAKQIEKEQMKKTWQDGFSFQSPYKNFQQYYNEIYNK